ncbi:MAG: MATE family efflux transporter, partial [Firmicutes bacterium]|nr:MATE family efflux transporter [Bacillota bacterium]
KGKLNMFKDKTFFKKMAALAVPIMLNEILNSSVNLLDTFMIGKLGEAPVAAVGLANQIFFLFIVVCFGINSGSQIFMGQFYGKGEHNGIHKCMGTTFVLSVMLSRLFENAAFFMPDKLMAIYSKDPKVIALGVSYLRIVAFSYIVSAMTVMINAALKSTGQVMQPMCTTFISLGCNFVFNLLFIYGLKLGVRGAAIATLTARTIELSAVIILVKLKKHIIAAKPADYFRGLDKPFLKAFFIVVVPVILNELMWALGTTIYNVAYKYSGTVAQAAVQISGTVQNEFMVAGIAIGSACGIMISNALGADDKDRAVYYSRKSMTTSLVFSTFAAVCLALAAPFIANFFDVTEEARRYARIMMYITSVGLYIKTLNFITIVGVLRNGGDTKFCLIADAVTVWFVGVPMAFLGSAVLHLPIYITFTMVYLEEVIKLFLTVPRVLKNKWINTLVN